MENSLEDRTNESDIIKEIYYFGSSKDGFNVYPSVYENENVSPRVFDFYYNNCAPEDWIIDLRKINSIIFHTYVQYGLLTSHDDGREGSHIGISIHTNCNYFNDMNLLYESFQNIKDAMLNEKRVIGKNKFGRMGFIPLRLNREGNYLDEFTQRIKKVFQKEKFKSKFKEVSQVISNDRYFKCHINSKPESFYEYFKQTGMIRVSDHEDYFLEK